MNLKAIIGLFMGLVIQLSQMQSCVAALPAGSAGMNALPACCCDELQSCPCASDRGPDQRPAPLIAPTVDLKLLISKATAADCLGAPVSSQSATKVAAVTRKEARSLYSGVPLAVAFCRFVI